MDSSEDIPPTFCIGQHETQRPVPISSPIIQLTREANYDMLTAPITTPHFQSRVLALLSSHLSNLQRPVYDGSGTLESSQNACPLTIPPLTPEDSLLTPNESMSQLVAVSSSWVDLCSPDPLIADISRQVLALEIAYAAFCGISFVIIPGPKLHHGNLHGHGLMYYARAIQEVMAVGPYIQIHIWLPMVDVPELEIDQVGDLSPFARGEYIGDMTEAPAKPDMLGTWDAWDVIRKMCRYQSRLFVALSLPKYLPPMPVQSRWHSEPVHILTIEETSFIKNPRGYPVLSKLHQAMISRFMRLRTPPWIILCNVGPIPGVDILQQIGGDASASSGVFPDSASLTPAEASQRYGHSGKKPQDPTPHLSYMRNLQLRQPPRTPLERFGSSYQDYLQAPLQPLTVNLESITYEVFEKDPIKYEWYERAIAKALNDWVTQKKPTSNKDGRIVLAVVGAGRGPLVTRALRASSQTGVDIDVWAVEKNENAFVLLQRHNTSIWNGRVNLVQSDMRSWKGPHRMVANCELFNKLFSKDVAVREKKEADISEANDTEMQSATSPKEVDGSPTSTHTPIDILVSELLGSFGDNELSPECLDGVTHLLNPVHGISIPASYSAHLSPISSPRLHADVTGQSITNPAAPETPYVVMLHAFDFLSTTQPPPSTSSPKPTGNSTPTGRSTSAGTPPPVPEPANPIVQTAWSFSHPNSNIPPPSPSSSVISNAHNVRRTQLVFPCRERGICHGLAGYFETVLYGDVELSTNPVTMDSKSAGMISWFPIYFPLKTPLTVIENSQIVITMFRQTDNRKVWYEWIVEVFALEKTNAPSTSSSVSSPTSPSVPTTPSATVSSYADLLKKDKQGENGNRSTKTSVEHGIGPAAAGGGVSGLRRVRIAMSELHSSIKDGCLM